MSVTARTPNDGSGTAKTKIGTAKTKISPSQTSTDTNAVGNFHHLQRGAWEQDEGKPLGDLLIKYSAILMPPLHAFPLPEGSQNALPRVLRAPETDQPHLRANASIAAPTPFNGMGGRVA